MEISPALPASLAGAMTDREKIVDAMYRCVLAFDTDDEELLNSACTDGVETSLPARGMYGKDLQDFKDQVFNAVSKLDTTHFLSNLRVNIESATLAKLTCSAMAVHCRKGTGVDPNSAKFTSGGLYTSDVVKEGDIWKLKSWRMDLIWLQGDPAVMDRE